MATSRTQKKERKKNRSEKELEKAWVNLPPILVINTACTLNEMTDRRGIINKRRGVPEKNEETVPAAGKVRQTLLRDEAALGQSGLGR